MGRPGIEYETVLAFIESTLADGGQPPSIAAIINACGGSATTIARYKRRYLEEAASGGANGTGIAGSGAALPDGLERSIARGASTLWAELIDALNDRETVLEAAYAEKSNEVDARLTEARDAQDSAEQHARFLQASLAELKEDRESERMAHAATRVALGEVQQALASRNAEYAALDKQLQRAHANSSKAERDWQARLAQAQQQLADANKQSQARIAALETAQETSERSWREVLADKERRLDAQVTELTAARQQLTEQEKALSTLAMRADTLTEQLKGCAKQTEKEQQRVETLRGQLSTAHNKSAEARAEIARLNDAIERGDRDREADAMAHQQQLADKDRQLKEMRTTLATLTNTLRRLESDPRT